jgi:hypothetical protein
MKEKCLCCPADKGFTWFNIHCPIHSGWARPVKLTEPTPEDLKKFDDLIELMKEKEK